MTIGSIARRCLEEYPDWASAAEAMRQEIEAPHLWEKFVEPLIRAAINDAIAKEAARIRAQYKPEPVDDVSGIVYAAKRKMASIMEYPLSSGLRLGDADRAALIQEAIYREEIAATNAANARWLRKIAELIGDKKVREALDEEKVRQLQLEAFNNV